MFCVKKFAAAFLIILCLAAPSFAAHTNVALVVAGSAGNATAPEFVNECNEGLKMAKHNYMRSLSTKLIDSKNCASKTDALEKASVWANLVIIPVEDFSAELPAVMRNHPNVTYVVFEAVPNAKVAHFRDEETGFLAGVTAALYLKNEKDTRINKKSRIGAIFGPENATIKRMKHGFRTGVWYIDKKLEPVMVHTEDFFNKEAAADYARRMHAKNIDIIFTAAGNAGLGASEVAEKEGFWTIGVDNEVEKTYPKAVLASAVKCVDYVIFAAIDRYMQKKLDANYVSLGVKEGAIGISTWTREAKSNIPLSIRKRIEEIENKVKTGLIVLPDMDGKNKE